MDVFIVRPFGTKQVVRKATANAAQEMVDFDFDKVQKELLDPALSALGLTGGTTARIFVAGEIRADMFSELLLADLVIADISVHNANVFYELGVRNALRDRTTVLIKSNGYDDTPFDIMGYRYVSYEKESPADALEELKAAISGSRDGTRCDSPVFNMLPGLNMPDTEKFYAVPPDFTEEATAAFATRDSGKLTLMVQQASLFQWKTPAMRLLGSQLYRLQAFKAARIAWEAVIEEKPADFDAANALSTIYQRLAEQEMRNNPGEAAMLLQRSDSAIERLLMSSTITPAERAEMYALKGRNAKTRWIDEWQSAPDGERAATALASSFWQQSFDNYELGFYTNLNHCYAGINCLALLTCITCLIDAMPAAWALPFDDQEEADEAMNHLKRKRSSLAAALKFSIEAEQHRLKHLDKTDSWLDVTNAGFVCLTATNPDKIAFAYKSVLRRCDQMQINSIIRQLLMYQSLNIMKENMEAALGVTGTDTNDETDNYYILFTGHMIDAPDRAEPRFPKEWEEQVCCEIEESVSAILQEQKGKDILGIAGGACGGDIIFHEVCSRLGVRSELYLALPKEQFIAESVSFAGGNWVDRFNKLYTTMQHRTLAQNKEIQAWLQEHSTIEFWALNNLWMLYNALANDSLNMSLVALWDGKGGDGEGGTAHMVKEVQQQGGNIDIISMPLEKAAPQGG